MSVKIWVKLVLILFVVAVGAGVQAAGDTSPSWWQSFGPKRQIHTLVVTGNYVSPRLLAELIQNESRQPFALFPTAGSNDSRIFVCPAKSDAFVVTESEFCRMVNFMNPRRIVVLGNSDYVQPKYLKLLDRRIPLFIVDGSDWQRCADELTFMLNLSNLSGNYKRLHAELVSSYRPLPQAPAAEETAPAAAGNPEALPLAE